jgi:multiple sugar transport system ATP-binding protein
MDEPLSNLDAKLRVETRSNIAALQARLKTTTLYVTHDQVEAMTMGHRVAVLKDGVLQQVDTPRNLYERPGNSFVAGFIGSPAMNLRTAVVDGAGLRLDGAAVEISPESAQAARSAGVSEVVVGVRPEALTMSAVPSGGLEVNVTLVEELGSDVYVYGLLPSDRPIIDKLFVIRGDGRVVPRVGETIEVVPSIAAIHLFHPETGIRLG